MRWTETMCGPQQKPVSSLHINYITSFPFFQQFDTSSTTFNNSQSTVPAMRGKRAYALFEIACASNKYPEIPCLLKSTNTVSIVIEHPFLSKYQQRICSTQLNELSAHTYTHFWFAHFPFEPKHARSWPNKSILHIYPTVISMILCHFCSVFTNLRIHKIHICWRISTPEVSLYCYCCRCELIRYAILAFQHACVVHSLHRNHTHLCGWKNMSFSIYCWSSCMFMFVFIGVEINAMAEFYREYAFRINSHIWAWSANRDGVANEIFNWIWPTDRS